MLLEMFITFFKIGAFTFGGGFAMIPIIQEEIVNKKSWIEEDDFLDIISLAQSAPGPIAVNSSIFVGYKIYGLPGAIACTLGAVLPSFMIILVIAKFFTGLEGSAIIDKIFAGIRPAVVALIFSTVYRLVKDGHFTYLALCVSLLVTIILTFIDINPIYIIILGVIASIIYNKYIRPKIDTLSS